MGPDAVLMKDIFPVDLTRFSVDPLIIDLDGHIQHKRVIKTCASSSNSCHGRCNWLRFTSLPSFFITLRDVYDGAIVLFSDASGDALSLCRNFSVEIRSLPHNQHSIDLYYTDRFIGYDHVCSDYDSRPCLCLATSFFQAYPFCDMPANFGSANGYQLILTEVFQDYIIERSKATSGWLRQ